MYLPLWVMLRSPTSPSNIVLYKWGAVWLLCVVCTLAECDGMSRRASRRAEPGGYSVSCASSAALQS
jgi:hypothetical protein